MLTYEEYAKYRDVWNEEVMLRSCMGTNFDSYRAIVGLGKDIIPHIIRDFKESLEHIEETGQFTKGYPRLGSALREVTGIDMAKEAKDNKSWPGMVGVNMQQLMQLWVEWYDGNNKRETGGSKC